jgi:hypothetical protein
VLIVVIVEMVALVHELDVATTAKKHTYAMKTIKPPKNIGNATFQNSERDERPLGFKFVM